MKDAKSDFGFMTYRLPIVVADLVAGEAAEKAGMKKGDKVLTVNDAEAQTWEKFTGELSRNAGKKVEITSLAATGDTTRVNLTVSEAGKIGIMLTPLTDIYQTKTINYTLLESVPRGIELGVDKLTSYVSQLKYVFTKEGAQNLGGFGAIGDMFPEQWSWYQFWVITAFISVALAFMNILPIPALDGGHVLFLLYELITRRQPSEKFLEYAQMVGLFLLIALLLYANGNDIYRFFIK